MATLSCLALPGSVPWAPDFISSHHLTSGLPLLLDLSPDRCAERFFLPKATAATFEGTFRCARVVPARVYKIWKKENMDGEGRCG